MLNWLIDLSLRHRAVVILVTLALGTVGVVSLTHLDVDAFPDTTPVQIQINTIAPSLAPEEAERQITFPIEQAISGLPHLEMLRSISKFGLSQVVVTFQDGTDIYFARQLVNERLGTVELPEGIARPQMGPVSTGLGEVFHYVLTYEGFDFSKSLGQGDSPHFAKGTGPFCRNGPEGASHKRLLSPFHEAWFRPMTERPNPRTREEQAKLEVGRTEISLGVKWMLFVVGLFTLFAVPAVQTYREMWQHAEGQRESPRPQCCDILDALPRAAAAFREHNGGWMSKTFRGNAVLLQAIDKYEKDLKAESFLTQFVLPPAQELLVYAGSGNEKGYVGRQRWLFYRPGIDYCTGPGFLNPRHMARRAESGRQWRPAPQPDPRAAIFQFHRQLAERNIRLVLMPTPDKATIHPEKFSSRYEGRRSLGAGRQLRQHLLAGDDRLGCLATPGRSVIGPIRRAKQA